MINGYIVLDKKMCPDPLEALKVLGTPEMLQKGGSSRGPWGGSPWPPYALRGILTYMPLRAAYGLCEDPGLTTYFFPGRDGVRGWG